ncbi:MAG: DNA polymerase III subunit alpha [Gammaproteobacteria bacterium]|nr:DNA polymerase III subunit alpha [Gammaproteobacteria bacterium]
MTDPGFVHLRVHSEFSLQDGLPRIPDLVARARREAMPAVALTDQSNLFASVKFRLAAERQGIKPVLGADVWLRNEKSSGAPWRLLLLCQDEPGYRRLSRLISRGFQENQTAGRACLDRSWLMADNEGLIALSGAGEGDVGQALLSGHPDRAAELAAEYARWFPGRFYMELQRVGRPDDEPCVVASVELAAQLGLPVVATNAVQFLAAEDFEAHEVRVCIQDGRVLADSRRPRRFTREQHFRGVAEMREVFRDLPEALSNSVEIARRCNLETRVGRHFLPEFPVPAGDSVEDLLATKAREGFARLLGELSEERAVYEQRLESELRVIIEMGFAGYFLIVADFIDWARQHEIPVGPGRGSGAGSLVAWALGITQLDPIAHGLLFERFLNPERVSMPDFDIDFCIEGRDRVIEYVASLYGRDKVAQIITHGTMAARAVVRDVGRVLSQPYGLVDKLAKLIPMDVGITLERALEQEELLRERRDQDDDVRELLDLAQSLEGLARNAGKHAGGVVIAPTALTDFTPLYCEPGSDQAVTQLDMKDLETIGLVKFDFLGLRTLTIIDKAVRMVNTERAAQGELPVELAKLPTDDPKAFDLLRSCRTTALFQLESRGMRDLIKRLQPDSFDDIVALVALFRPGPLGSGMVEDFIKRKHGRARIAYLHPALEAILKPTYGVILYQEQVMEIAQVLAGYSLGAADLLRRAMGKKKVSAMAKQRDIFVSGAVERGVRERDATFIFDLMEKFAGYGFNKSHSAAYALIAYQTAWLKAHYPAIFMSAALSADMEHTDKIVTLIAECRDLGMDILPPDINRCEFAFTPVSDREILYGLGAIKGVGRQAIENLVDARNQDGRFADIFDLCRRVDARRVNRRALESLVRAGALDCFGEHRAQALALLAAAMEAASQENRDREASQNDLFGIETPAVSIRVQQTREWSEEERLNSEKETLGLFLTGHPIERYESELAQIVDARLRDLRPTEDRNLTVAGLVMGLRMLNTKRGDRMAFLTLDDQTGRVEIAVFSDLFSERRELLVKDNLLVVEGRVSVDEFTGGIRMRAESIRDLSQARDDCARDLLIVLDADQAGSDLVGELRIVLNRYHGGRCRVRLRYHGAGAEADMVLGANWMVTPSQSLLSEVGELVGDEHVSLRYGPRSASA